MLLTFSIISIFKSIYFLKMMPNFKITSMQVGNSYYTDEMYTKLHSIKSNLTKHLVILTMTGYKYRNWPKLKANRHKDTYCTKMTWNDIAKKLKKHVVRSTFVYQIIIKKKWKKERSNCNFFNMILFQCPLQLMK